MQHAILERREFRRCSRAWPRQRHRLIERNASLFDQQDPVGKRDGLLHVVRHEQRGKAMLTPQPLDQRMHLDAGQGVERAERLVQQQQLRTMHERARQRDALPLAARQLRGPGGCTFERYRGRVGDIGYVADDEAHAVPEGVPELFITRFAPADYVEAVNTTGLPYYAKQELMDFGKGVEIEAQSNPIHLCTRPKAIVKLKA